MTRLGKIMNGVGVGLSTLTFVIRWYATGQVLWLAWVYRWPVDICLGLAGLVSMVMITINGLQISRQIILHKHPQMSEAESVMFRRQLEAEGYYDNVSPMVFYLVFTVMSFYLVDYTKMMPMGILLFFAQSLSLLVNYWRRREENLRFPAPKG